VKPYVTLGLALLTTLYHITPATAEFRKITYHRSERCAVTLPSVSGVAYRCRRWLDETAKLTVWQSALGFEFGSLSRQTWQSLMQIYTRWHNWRLLPPYDASRHYELLDFMPPTIQALDRHRFIGQKQMWANHGQPQSVQLVGNCWGTAYEILRLAKKTEVESPVLFAAAATPMLKTLEMTSVPVSATQARAGDLLLLSHHHGDRIYLDHVALVIDQGLFFEKAGSGDDVPYRFVDIATLKQTWNPAIFAYSVRRPLPQRNLPHPTTTFSLGNERQYQSIGSWPFTVRQQLTVVEDPDTPPTWLWMQPLPPLQRVQGRSQLPTAAYQPDRLWPITTLQKRH
jgi:hypothetical protein